MRELPDRVPVVPLLRVAGDGGEAVSAAVSLLETRVADGVGLCLDGAAAPGAVEQWLGAVRHVAEETGGTAATFAALDLSGAYGDGIDLADAGGILKRAVVAGAIPCVWLAKPLSAATASRCRRLLAELNREENVTLVVVTPAMALAEEAERVFELADGRLAERKGPP